jgi:hypothetical protein
MKRADLCCVNAGDWRIAGTFCDNHWSPVAMAQSCVSSQRFGVMNVVRRRRRRRQVGGKSARGDDVVALGAGPDFVEIDEWIVFLGVRIRVADEALSCGGPAARRPGGPAAGEPSCVVERAARTSIPVAAPIRARQERPGVRMGEFLSSASGGATTLLFSRTIQPE